MTWGNPFRCETWSLPSKDLRIVTHLLCWSGQLRALSKSSMAPLFFFNFLTKASTAFSAHFSSSSPGKKYSEIYNLVYFKNSWMGVFFPFFIPRFNSLHQTIILISFTVYIPIYFPFCLKFIPTKTIAYNIRYVKNKQIKRYMCNCCSMIKWSS
jgi:hypothetical protein